MSVDFWQGWYCTSGLFYGCYNFGCNQVFQFLAYQDMVYIYKLQFFECVHPQVSNFHSNQYLLSRYEIALEITPTSWVFNSYSTNTAQIQNRRLEDELASQTA